MPSPGTGRQLQLVGVGIDRGLPLGVTGLRARCDINIAPRKGPIYLVGIWVLQRLVWALVTLIVASYIGLVRKPG